MFPYFVGCAKSGLSLGLALYIATFTLSLFAFYYEVVKGLMQSLACKEIGKFVSLG